MKDHKEEKAKVIVISDLHIGGANTAKDLSPLISFIHQIDASVTEELVIAGDMFDRWAHPRDVIPPTFEAIKSGYTCMKDADNKVNRQNTYIDFWDAINTCAKKEGIKVYYMNGNHDEEMSEHDFKPHGMIELIEHKKHVRYTTPDDYFKHHGNRIYIAHGHQVDLFNAPGHSDDKKIHYPLGYFKTRMHHSVPMKPMRRDYHVNNVKSEIIRELLDTHKNTPYKEMASKSQLDDYLVDLSLRFIDALRKDMSEAFGVSENELDQIKCQMPRDIKGIESEINFQEVLNRYKHFVKHFYYDQLLPALGQNEKDAVKVPWEYFAHAIDIVRSGGLTWYAEHILEHKNADVVIFGHSHMNQTQKIPKTDKFYANSGCWCESGIGPNTTSVSYYHADGNNRIKSVTEVIELD